MAKIYTKLDENTFKESESVTETREQEYKLGNLLANKQSLLAALEKVKTLIDEAEKLGIK